MENSNLSFGACRAESWAGAEENLDTMINFAKTVEQLGFDSVHVGDHVHVRFEPLTTLTAIAMKTKKLKIATNILDMNRRNPATVAHVTATLDHFSNGRLILGAGCGMWNWRTYNIPNIGDTGRVKANRKVSRSKEAIEVLKKFWTETEVNYTGQFYNYDKGWIILKPLQKPHPPIWIAAYGKRMKRIAAKLGDGFITQTVTSSIYRDEVELVKSYANKQRKDPKNITPVFATLTGIANNHNDAIKKIQTSARSLLFKSVNDHADHHNRLAEKLGYDELVPWEKPDDVTDEDICQVYLIGTPEEIISRIEEYKKAGMNYLILMGLRTMDSIKLYSEKVIPCFKD